MERNVSMEEISDGKRYELNDMVKADCNGCKECSACCQRMGNSIILDPYDSYRLVTNLSCTFETLLADKIELNVVNGIILPNLKMAGASERCAFLNEEDRCSIHPFRPGICRLFPLGRYYENHAFTYFLQVHECKYPNKAKVKVRKWIDTPDIKQNEQFVTEWHYFLKNIQNLIKSSQDDNQIKLWNLYLLNNFYLKPFETGTDFYVQIQERFMEAKKFIN